ncbi:hypothetical protein [Paenibacillus sinopodophylli]|uniref:hypothetical protein n=1 Tax=Paenibacillus sinopodophylli TaxID=1837342 RepID=UPI00110CA8CF|nr:hypothetical protein [Paenibacillus sinopodophylli]
MGELLSLIYNFFPKGIAFNDVRYKLSEEYNRLSRKRNEFKGKTSLLVKEIEKLLPEYSVVDWTNLEEYNCMQYKVLIAKDQKILDDDVELINVLGGRRIDLVLYVSILGDFYYFNYVNTNLIEGNWHFSSVNVINKEMQRISIEIDSLMKRKKRTKLEDLVCKSFVPDLETELLNFGEVRVFNCLFSELDTI